MAQLTFSIPTGTALRIGGCCVVLLLVLFVGVYPLVRKIQRLDETILNTEGRIKQHEAFSPIHASLATKIKDQPSDKLPTPAMGAVDVNEMSGVAPMLRAVIVRSGMEPATVSPDPKSLSDKKGLLLVNCVLKGDFYKFRQTLIDLGGVPALAHIEEITIGDSPAGREYHVKLWLRLEAKTSTAAKKTP